MYDIPMYLELNGEAFDALHFGLEQFTSQKTKEFLRSKGMPSLPGKDILNANGEFYVVSTVNGALLCPYKLWQGQESAESDVENRIIEYHKKNHCYDIPYLQKKLLYRLWFRVYGEWKKGWYNILLEEEQGTKAYIRHDEARICFVNWEKEFRRDCVRFHGHELYEKPEGKKIRVDDNDKMSYRILGIDGDWVYVGDNRMINKGIGWLQWRDDNGILPGISSFDVIY